MYYINYSTKFDNKGSLDGEFETYDEALKHLIEKLMSNNKEYKILDNGNVRALFTLYTISEHKIKNINTSGVIIELKDNADEIEETVGMFNKMYDNPTIIHRGVIISCKK